MHKGRAKKDPKMKVSTQKLLNRISDFYHLTIRKDREGIKALSKLGLSDGNIIETFRLGYSNGSLFDVIPERGDIVESLKDLGILKEHEEEHFKNCVTIPIFDKNGSVVQIIGRNPDTGRELPLFKETAGIFNSTVLKSHGEILLSDNIIDTLHLYEKGLKNVISSCIHENLIKTLKENNTKELIFLYSPENKEKERLTFLKTRTAPLPENLKSFSKEEIKELIYSKKEETPFKTNSQKPLIINNGFIFEICKRRYAIRGLEGSEKKLKANIKAEHLNKFHIDTIDLYSSKSRKNFIKELSLFFSESPQIIKEDINRIIEMAEKHVTSKKQPKKEEYIITSEERKEALKFGKSPNLIENILSDITACGYVGEETNKLISYLAMTSRKMEDPLSILIISGSGAGKSSLQDTILSLCPPEESLKLTALTGKALFYKKEFSLSHRVLAIEEDEGALQANYAIRNLISSKELSIETTIKDSSTGKMTTMENIVKGPTAVFKTTTNPETDPESKSRFITISIDESREQTRRILKKQREECTLEGYFKKENKESITRKHRNFQRSLRSLAVFNPYAKLLTYLDDRILVRRENPKYLNIISCIAFLHQMQREIKVLPNGREYIEVTLEDIKIANELAHSLLGKNLDELSDPSKRLLKEIENMVKKKMEEDNRPKEHISFTRRDIREYTKWSDYQVRTHLKELVDLECILPVSGKNGIRYQYELLYSNDTENRTIIMMGLKNVETLKEEAEKAPILAQPCASLRVP
ncbi:MAG: hypothetical protein KAQ99_05530 [Candidatus Aureabacteria bacterium]|nr:hypothetical protein [Candidatus Auribacterota bacterium]